MKVFSEESYELAKQDRCFVEKFRFKPGIGVAIDSIHFTIGRGGFEEMSLFETWIEAIRRALRTQKKADWVNVVEAEIRLLNWQVSYFYWEEA